METLKKLVGKLEMQADEKEIIATLQEIGAKLINEYEIQVDKFVLQPVLIETYYFEENKFRDTSVYATSQSKAKSFELARTRQKNHFAELYVHYGKNYGIDLVLSMGEYYLSFLIKCALVDDDFAAQCRITGIVCGQCDMQDKCSKGMNCIHYGERILRKVENRKKKIVCFPRKGTKGYYSHAPLAMVAVDVFKNKPQYEVVKNSLEKNFKKEWILAKYALENGESTPEEIRGFLKNEGLCSYNIGLKSIEGEIGENGEVKSVGAREYVNKWK